MNRFPSTKIGAAVLLVFAAGCSTADESSPEDGSQESELAASARIDVEPYATIGTGNPGSGEFDVNTPDGVIFDKNGNLLLTDALNHRVQVWDVRKHPRRLGQFGSPDVFRGEIVDLAQSPVTGQLIVTDEDTHVAYAYAPPSGDEEGDLKYSGYKLQDANMFAWEHVKKVGGITFDSKGRIYTVDAKQNLVRRYDANGKPDPTFKFAEKGGTAYLDGCEGIAVDEKRGNLYVSSEFTSSIQVFDRPGFTSGAHLPCHRPEGESRIVARSRGRCHGSCALGRRSRAETPGAHPRSRHAASYCR